MLMILTHSSTFLYQSLIRKKHLFLSKIILFEQIFVEFLDFHIQNHDLSCPISYYFRVLQLRSCAYYPKYGFGAFGTFPLLLDRYFYIRDILYIFQMEFCSILYMEFCSYLYLHLSYVGQWSSLFLQSIL